MEGNSESMRSSATEYETISKPSGFDGLSSSTVTEAFTSRKKNRRKKKKQQQIFIEGLDQVIVGSSGKHSNSLSTDPDNNSVLRKLLRPARYFDPPRESGLSCRNCGEVGHREGNCSEPKRRRPCYVCGTYEHNWKRCKLRRKCCICKERGHLVKHCPVSNKGNNISSNICLRCGIAPEHDMFSCFSDYCPDDIKEIRCYICKSFGHLSCADPLDAYSVPKSCYTCGRSGHLGYECIKVHDDNRDISTQVCLVGEDQEVKLQGNSQII